MMLLNLINTIVLAQAEIGKIKPPSFIAPGIEGGKLTGIVVFFNSILKLVFIVGGLWAFINFIMAGYEFLKGAGDPKAIAKGWEKIWQSFLGILIIVSSFIFAAIIGIVLFKNAGAILSPDLSIK